MTKRMIDWPYFKFSENFRDFNFAILQICPFDGILKSQSSISLFSHFYLQSVIDFRTQWVPLTLWLLPDCRAGQSKDIWTTSEWGHFPTPVEKWTLISEIAETDHSKQCRVSFLYSLVLQHSRYLQAICRGGSTGGPGARAPYWMPASPVPRPPHRGWYSFCMFWFMKHSGRHT